ncbi:MAG: hypothetical protein JJE18_01530 [Eubacteriaceae bacterium]|nr:hypothetical protein [Eubacteriaceae bacterium]
MGVFLFLVFVILIFIFLVKARDTMAKKKKEKLKSLNIPVSHKIMQYFRGYDKTISSVVYYWESNGVLNFLDAKPVGVPTHIKIPKEQIINFMMIGDMTSNTSVSVKGGGVSLGGAAVGGVLLGPVGAIIGGRKKVKSTSKTVKTDNRQVVLNFKENGSDKSILIDKSIYPELCMICGGKVAS